MVVVPTKMGQLNKRALLLCLQQIGAASRAELAKTLELSQPTVGKIADELIRTGIVEEAAGRISGSLKSKAGRPGRVLNLNRSKPRLLGVHVDVHETSFSLMPIQPQPQDRWDLVLPTAGNEADWMKLFREAECHLRRNDLLGIILSVPGIVDEAAGRVLFSPNLHWTEKTFLPASMHEVWSLPIVVIQELRALALGYSTLEGADEDFLAVDFGEGVGAAAVVGRRLYASQLPSSGELGHTPVPGNSRTCGCGAVGCLETLASRRGLLHSFAEAEGNFDLTLGELNKRIREQGIPGWLDNTLEAAASVIAGALNVMGLRRVVVSGAVKDLPESVHQRFATAINKGALWQRFGEVSCVFAPRHYTAGMAAVGLDRLIMPATTGTPLAHLPGNLQQLTG